jgi:hypothetical protein
VKLPGAGSHRPADVACLADAYFISPVSGAGMTTRKRKQVWDKPPPKKAAHTHLSPAKKKSAKAAAKRAGRPYPNLVDNMRAAKKKPGTRKAGTRKAGTRKAAKTKRA